MVISNKWTRNNTAAVGKAQISEMVVAPARVTARTQPFKACLPSI